jgi:hypothetical protein
MYMNFEKYKYLINEANARTKRRHLTCNNFECTRERVENFDWSIVNLHDAEPSTSISAVIVICLLVQSLADLFAL